MTPSTGQLGDSIIRRPGQLDAVRGEIVDAPSAELIDAIETLDYEAWPDWIKDEARRLGPPPWGRGE